MSDHSRGEGYQKITATAVGTNAGGNATLSGAAGFRVVVTHISGSGDAAAVVTLELPAGTVVWQKRFAAAFTFSEDFGFGEYEAGDNVNAVVKISASTSHCEANIGGLKVGY